MTGPVRRPRRPLDATAVEILAVSLFFIAGGLLSIAFAMVYLSAAIFTMANQQVPWIINYITGVTPI